MSVRTFGAGLVVCMVWALTGRATLCAQSLGEIARRAQEQRQSLDAPSKVYTNDSLEPVRGPSPATSAPTVSGPTATPPSQSGTAGTAGDAGDDEEGAANTRGEDYWRQRMQDERAALSRAETFAAALQSQINGLWAEFTACDAPPQCNKASEDRQKAMAELERVRGEVATHTENIAKIQEEARRANVPAGWVR